MSTERPIRSLPSYDTRSQGSRIATAVFGLALSVSAPSAGKTEIFVPTQESTRDAELAELEARSVDLKNDIRAEIDGIEDTVAKIRFVSSVFDPNMKNVVEEALKTVRENEGNLRILANQVENFPAEIKINPRTAFLGRQLQNFFGRASLYTNNIARAFAELRARVPRSKDTGK